MNHEQRLIIYCSLLIAHRALVRLPARKTSLIEAAIYRTLVRPALRRMFQRVALGGPASAPAHDLPMLVYSSHPSWWDGYIAFLLSREVWRDEGYLMMEEPQLRRYGFFRYCGAFSVDRYDPREGMRAVQYAAALLRDSRRMVWIFPQGEIVPSDRRPLVTFSGAAHIATRAAPVRCVPVALRFEFGGEQRPEALIRLGESHVVESGVNAKILHREMDQRLLTVMDALRDEFLSGATTGYRTILTGRESINVTWDRIREGFVRRRSRLS